MRNTRPPLTEKDIADLEFGLALGVDIVALSFVRSEADVRDLTERLRESGQQVDVVAKIEKPEAVDRIDEIIEQSGAVMVARGDLGIEMPLAQVPLTQKEIVSKCLAAATPVITATQMLESMISNPRPTRAEASDVANAVLDGTDAVMLSGETAAGRYPVRTVQVMAEIIESAELQYPFGADGRLYATDVDQTITESVSNTACRLAESTGASAIACLTATGATARTIARHRPSVPLFAFTDDERVVRKLGLLWGTKGFAIPFQHDTDRGVDLVHRVLSAEGLVTSGDRIVITAGMPLPRKGRTNMVQVSQVP